MNECKKADGDVEGKSCKQETKATREKFKYNELERKKPCTFNSEVELYTNLVLKV
jgi:hypothetical protein